MYTAGELLFGGTIFLILQLPCPFLMHFVRPRWFGWITSGLWMLAVSFLVFGTMLGVVFTYGAPGMYIENMLILWPLPVALVTLICIPTRPKRAKANHCPCGYDLTGNTTGICPECGVEINIEKRSPLPGANRG